MVTVAVEKRKVRQHWACAVPVAEEQWIGHWDGPKGDLPGIYESADHIFSAISKAIKKQVIKDVETALAGLSIPEITFVDPEDSHAEHQGMLKDPTILMAICSDVPAQTMVALIKPYLPANRYHVEEISYYLTGVYRY